MSFPASVRSVDAAYQHIQGVVYYQRTAIENLKANLCTYRVMQREPIPQRNGKTMQFYVNSILAGNTTSISEGTTGAPISNASTKNTVSLSQYGDWMSFSDFVEETAISRIINEHAVELGYRAARSVDTLNYTQFDTTSTSIAASRIDLIDNEYLTSAQAKRGFYSLAAANVKTKSGGLLDGIMHPLVAFDFMSDNTAGSALEILKWNDYSKLKTQMQNFFVIQLDGIRWVASTQVPTSSNYPSSGKTGYHSYIFGQDAFFCAELAGTSVPKERNFVAGVDRQKRDSSNPMGLIAATAFYNFKYATYVAPDSVARHRRYRSEASIT
jgi:N4-gp56 family major capsid protein